MTRSNPHRTLVLGATLLAAVLVLPACRPASSEGGEIQKAPAGSASAASDRGPLHVETTIVTQRPMPQYLTLTGSLRANEESDLGANATGRVVATYCERGQAVKRGQILVVLDARGEALAATAAQAQAKMAQSQLEQARRDCERVRHLLDTGAISQAEFDRQTSTCTSQQWSAAAAEAQQQSATKVLGDTNIRAPFDGVVGERYVNVGQYVQGNTRVASIYQDDPLRLQLTVPEENVASIKQDMPVTFTVVAYGDHAFAGQVKYISPNLREATRDLVVEAVVPNADGRLKPGMFAVAKLLLSMNPQPVVPPAALLRDDTGARLFAVVNHQAQERLVQLGETQDDSVAVLSGVRPGETVVLHPGPDLRDGAHLE